MAKKYSNKVPRKTKKAVKKAAGKQGQKITAAEAVTLANKQTEKNRRANAAARRYNENKTLLESVGLPTNIITKSTSKKETQRIVSEHLAQQKKAARKAKNEERFISKIQTLINEGFTAVDAKKIVGSPSHQISFDRINEIIAEKNRPPINDNIKLSSDVYLYVGYAETNDDMDMQTFRDFSSAELREIIATRLDEVEKNPDGSDSMTGVFVIDSGDYVTMSIVAEDYYKRGYNFKMTKKRVKLDSNRYYKMTLHNTYTEQNFLQLVALVLCNAKNDMVKHYLHEFRIYCTEAGFPYLDEI